MSRPEIFEGEIDEIAEIYENLFLSIHQDLIENQNEEDVELLVYDKVFQYFKTWLKYKDSTDISSFISTMHLFEEQFKEELEAVLNNFRSKYQDADEKFNLFRETLLSVWLKYILG